MDKCQSNNDRWAAFWGVLENLELLCPNCHALTPTYRGKNKGRVAEWQTLGTLG